MQGPCFVFGSNLAGIHGAGAARYAVLHHGAIMGQGVGIQGNSCAIPTRDERIETLEHYDVGFHVSQFIVLAKWTPGTVYHVTRIGCGLAGFSDRDIAPLFINAPRELSVLVGLEAVAPEARDLDGRMTTEFYLQDSRSYLGNDIVWWAKDGCGYTTDLRKAHVFTLEDAQRYHSQRHTDVPWPKDYIDQRTRPAVDVQYCNKAEALKGSGIVLVVPPKPKAERFRCYHCGVFMRQRDQYGPCPKCGGDNCP